MKNKESKKVKSAVEKYFPELDEEVSTGLTKAIFDAARTFQLGTEKAILGKIKGESIESIKEIRKTVEELRETLEFSDSSIDEDLQDIYEKLDSVEGLIETSMEMAVATAADDATPKFDEIQTKLEEAVKTIEEKLRKAVDSIEKYDDKELKEGIRVLKADNKVHFKSTKELRKEFEKLEEMVIKFSKATYEYGSSFSVLANGNLVGQSFGINFKNGTNTTVVVTSNTQGFIDVAINATGSGGTGYQQPTSGIVDGSNKVFVFATAPNVICVDQGRTMQATSSDTTVNWTGTTTVTLKVAPTSDIFGVA